MTYLTYRFMYGFNGTRNVCVSAWSNNLQYVSNYANAPVRKEANVHEQLKKIIQINMLPYWLTTAEKK